MRVLLGETDLFKSVGGGQTIYQGLVRSLPETEFHYFVDQEALDAPRPANARPIPRLPPILETPSTVAAPYLISPWREATQLARSVKAHVGACHFDVVDVPDYADRGLFLRQALEAEGFTVGKTALALHGSISSALEGGWPWTDDPARLFAEIRLRERLQRQTVDTLYAISDTYADAIEKLSGRQVHRLDPLVFLAPADPVAAPPGDAPDVVFVGRRERRKGPDLLIDLAWSLPREAYQRLRFIGGDGVNHQGTGASDVLSRAARLRGVDFTEEESLPQDELREVFRSRSVVVVPSRYDQFNLVALEALLRGCPTVISRQAGVARFVKERLPELAWLVVDFNCDGTAGALVAQIARDYDAVRAKIAAAVRRAKLKPDLAGLTTIYGPLDSSNTAVARRVRDAGHAFNLRLATANGGPRPALPDDLTLASMAVFGAAASQAGRAFGDVVRKVRPPRLPDLRQAFRDALADRVRRNARLSGRAAHEFALAGSADWQRDAVAAFPERTSELRERKLAAVNEAASTRQLGRVYWYSELARQERIRGAADVAALYDARIARWLGEDRFAQLPLAQADLGAAGYEAEAAILPYLIDETPAGQLAARTALDAQVAANLAWRPRKWQRQIDRRGKRKPKVSVIVSLYDAAEKLPRFLADIRRQTLVQSGEAEIVLVDSGSPADEAAAFEANWPTSGLSAVYARSPKRETIAAAWNRGIHLARGEYLTFLGVDEGLRPDGLERLAQVLDADPACDWVMADSLVTEVDARGVFDHDVMIYDRAGLQPHSPYLESMYLSYVGGLYRRSVHDRVGWYDETFRAASDTEFKNRALPHLKIAHLALPLGVFRNYPDARMTHHPRAEIEDQRAWYLHRSPGGVAYAFDGKPVEAAVALLRDCLGYRKSYCTHDSTDIDLATSVTIYLAQRTETPQWASIRDEALKLRGQIAQLEFGRTRYAEIGAQYAFARQVDDIRKRATQLATLVGRDDGGACEVFNDNRYEQHSGSWSS
jgi:glycosyltransferase involved in cell wall biosynthesis